MSWNWKGFIIVNILSSVGWYIGFYGFANWGTAMVSLGVVIAMGLVVYLYRLREERSNRSYKRQSRPEMD